MVVPAQNLNHLASIFIMNAGIFVSVNTFISLRDGSVGLVVALENRARITIRHFLSHLQLLQHVSNVVDGDIVSFWPHASSLPHYLCDSDLTSVIDESLITGLAFVLFDDSPLLGS